MKYNERVMSLQSKHQKLDSYLSMENGRPKPDTEKITQLKKQKLAIKQEIAVLQQFG